MRRRGHTIQTGAYYPSSSHSTSPAAYVAGPHLVISEVPEEWRKHALEPWRLLFPDLEWAPTGRDDQLVFTDGSVLPAALARVPVE